MTRAEWHGSQPRLIKMLMLACNIIVFNNIIAVDSVSRSYWHYRRSPLRLFIAQTTNCKHFAMASDYTNTTFNIHMRPICVYITQFYTCHVLFIDDKLYWGHTSSIMAGSLWWNFMRTTSARRRPQCPQLQHQLYYQQECIITYIYTYP